MVQESTWHSSHTHVLPTICTFHSANAEGARERMTEDQRDPETSRLLAAFLLFERFSGDSSSACPPQRASPLRINSNPSDCNTSVMFQRIKRCSWSWSAKFHRSVPPRYSRRMPPIYSRSRLRYCARLHSCKARIACRSELDNKPSLKLESESIHFKHLQQPDLYPNKYREHAELPNLEFEFAPRSSYA